MERWGARGSGGGGRGGINFERTVGIRFEIPTQNKTSMLLPKLC